MKCLNRNAGSFVDFSTLRTVQFLFTTFRGVSFSTFAKMAFFVPCLKGKADFNYDYFGPGLSTLGRSLFLGALK